MRRSKRTARSSCRRLPSWRLPPGGSNDHSEVIRTFSAGVRDGRHSRDGAIPVDTHLHTENFFSPLIRRVARRRARDGMPAARLHMPAVLRCRMSST